MADINLDNLLNQTGGRAMFRDYIDKRLLERREWDGVLSNPKWFDNRSIPMQGGQYIELTRRRGIRRPQKMPNSTGAGSDPASGVELGYEQINVPLEYIHEYGDIATVAGWTSWDNIDNFAKEEMPTALMRRDHELVQNCFKVGRMKPGLYASDGSVTTPFDQEVEATISIGGNSFTFDKFPSYYANGKSKFADLKPGDVLTWEQMRRYFAMLSMSGAMREAGSYICVISMAAWLDLMKDTDEGRLPAAMAGGLKTAIRGLEKFVTFDYAGFTFIIDDQPFTMNTGAANENKRANFGPIHAVYMFGMKCAGFVPLGKKNRRMPKFKTQDITKTGHSYSIGYMVPGQIAVQNPRWGMCVHTHVSQSRPNGFDPSDPGDILDGFAITQPTS